MIKPQTNTKKSERNVYTIFLLPFENLFIFFTLKYWITIITLTLQAKSVSLSEGRLTTVQFICDF